MLTIAIPTYNRNDILKKNLQKLLPQLTKDCRLIIFDNCSDIPVSETIDNLLKPYSHLDIAIKRNNHNVGMTGNILKCFEECTDSWLWILGDDDEIMDGAISTIFKDIERRNETYFITYAWDEDSLSRDEEVLTTGIDEFIDTFETFGVVLFLSTSIYNVEKVKKSMPFANFFQSSYAPHLVMLFMSLGEKGKCLYSKEQIVTNKAEETPIDLRWDQIFIYQITLLLRLPLRPRTILRLKKRLEQLTRVWNIYHFIFTLTFMKSENGSINKPIVLYGEIVRSFYNLDKRVFSRIACFCGYFIVRYPFLFRWFFARIYKILKGKEFKSEIHLRI